MSEQHQESPPEALEGLIRSARDGDRAAFSQLLSRIQDRTMALAYGRLGQAEPARDAAQDALLDAYLHLGELREPAAFWGWFRRVVWKHCDRRTRRKRPAPAELRRHGELTAPAGPPPDEQLAAEQRRAWMRLSIDELPEAQRQVVALHYLADLPLSQAAVLLGIRENAAKQRLYAARQRLKQRKERAMDHATGDEVGGALQSLKPSGDAAFAAVVRLFLAIRAGDTAEVRGILDADATLVDARESWDVRAFPNRAVPIATAASPLIRAAELGQVDLIELLLERGADVDGACGCVTRESPLWAAAASLRLAAARCLLEAGADPDRAGASGIAPLHIAAMRGSEELAALLLEHGAACDARDPAGRRAADWASLKGHSKLAVRLAAEAGGATLPAALQAPGGSTALPGDPLPTGIKVVDLFAPIPDGGIVRVEGGARVGRNVFLAELAHVASHWPRSAVVWVDWEREVWSGNELRGLIHEGDLAARVHVVSHAHGDRPEEIGRLGDRALAFADGLLAAGDVDRVLMVFFEQRGVRAHVEALLPDLIARAEITACVVSPWEDSDPSVRLALPYDVLWAFSEELAARRLYPAIDPARSMARLDPEHVSLVERARALLGDRGSARAERLRAYLTQPFHVAEPNSGRPGERVDPARVRADVAAILEGAADATELSDLLYRGGLDG